MQPTVGKAFRGVKRDTLLTLESRRGRRSAWGLKAIPGEQGTPFLPSPELRTQSKECCTRIVPFTPDNKSKPVFWVFDGRIWSRSSTVLGVLTPFGVIYGFEGWPLSRPVLAPEPRLPYSSSCGGTMGRGGSQQGLVPTGEVPASKDFVAVLNRVFEFLHKNVIYICRAFSFDRRK